VDGEAPSHDDQTLMMIMMDPPRHTRYRKLVNRAFTPRTVLVLEASVRQRSQDLLDAAIAKGASDFVVDVAAELPSHVIADLLGVDEDDRPDILAWTNQMVTGGDDPEYQAVEGSFESAAVQLAAYAFRLVQERRANPRDDLVSGLVAADIDGHALSDLELVRFFVLLAVAGNETTRNTLAHGIDAFTRFPEQYELLLERQDLASVAVEELLRWSTPINYFCRQATEDAEVEGQAIRAGDRVSIWYASANRDDDHFTDPFTFDITRTPNEHVSLGAGGPHFCLGASLARLEIRVLLEELAQRAPKISPLGGPDRLRSNHISGIKHLPVQFDR
jgi:cholest-4-en-3-one 26-monooxygenase